MISYTIFKRKSLKSPKIGLSGDSIENPGKSHGVPGVALLLWDELIERYKDTKKTGAIRIGPEKQITLDIYTGQR